MTIEYIYSISTDPKLFHLTFSAVGHYNLVDYNQIDSIY